MRKRLLPIALCFLGVFSYLKINAQTLNSLWAKSAGGGSTDMVNSVAVDANGNSFITGYFHSLTITFGSTTLINANTVCCNTTDFFVAKYDASGNALWAKSAGGIGNEYGTSITVDANGNSYVIGYFYNSPTITFGSYTLTNGGGNIFIVKYDATGNVVWAKTDGGTGSSFESRMSISVDANGNSYITGQFFSPTVVFGSTVLTNSHSPQGDIFVVKYNAAGNVLWAKRAGGYYSDWGSSISIDSNGNIYVIGEFGSGAITLGSYTLTNTGSWDIWLAKYDASGNVLWAKSVEAFSDHPSIAVDANGNAYITGGFFNPTVVFGNTTLTNTDTTGSSPDVFVAKYDISGNVLWANSLGGSSDDKSKSITVEANGNSYITGLFYSPTIEFDCTTLTNGGGNDIFVAKYDPLGNTLCAKSAGGPYGDGGNSIKVDACGNSYVTGDFQSPAINFDNTTLTNSSGYSDVFIVKFGQCNSCPHLPGTVLSEQKISNTQGLFTGILDNDDRFGNSVTSIGDLDGDSITDIAVGAYLDDDGGSNRGAIWIMFLNQNGTVKSNQKISSTTGNFSGALNNVDAFGQSVSPIGDLDGDGIVDIAVGAMYDDNGGTDRGAVWILFLNTNGTVKSFQKISNTQGNFTGILDNQDVFGVSVAGIGDLDADGINDIAVGALGDDDSGTNRGAVWILFLNANGTVKSHQKISGTQGNFIGILDNSDFFGNSISSIGDFDKDGITDISVGAYYDDDGGTDRGAVWILFLNSNGTVKSFKKISATQGNFSGSLVNSNNFGVSISAIGDLDNDSITDIVVGAFQDDDGGTDRGAVWVLFLNSDGTVKSQQKISNTQGNFSGILDNSDYFGVSVTSLGDKNYDGFTDIAVGAFYDDDGGTERGALWLLYLDGIPLCVPSTNIINANICSNDSIYLGGNWQNSTCTYYDTLLSLNGCDSLIITQLTVNQLPSIPSITANGSTTFCQGDSVTLSVSSTNAYLWSNGATTQSIIVSTQGNYAVTVTDNNGCSANSLGTTVTVNPLPTIPTITANGTTLTSSSTIGNQWYLNGNIISGATSQNYSVTQNGNYTVITTDSNGCSATSIPYSFTSIGIDEFTTDNSFIIIPNPNYGKFRLQSDKLQLLKIKIYNVIGEIIFESVNRNSEIDLSKYPKGIYSIEIITQDKSFNKKLIIQ